MIKEVINIKFIKNIKSLFIFLDSLIINSLKEPLFYLKLSFCFLMIFLLLMILSKKFRHKMLIYNSKLRYFRSYPFPVFIHDIKLNYGYVIKIVFAISILFLLVFIALTSYIWPLLSALGTILAVWTALYVHNEQPKMKLNCDLQLKNQSAILRVFNERNSSSFVKCSDIHFKDHTGFSLFGDSFNDILQKYYGDYYNINADEVTKIELNKDDEGYNRMQYIYNRIRNCIVSNDKYKKVFDDNRIEKGSIIMLFSDKDRPRISVTIPIESLLLRGMVVKK